jgi:hypothetical protein
MQYQGNFGLLLSLFLGHQPGTLTPTCGTAWMLLPLISIKLPGNTLSQGPLLLCLFNPIGKPSDVLQPLVPRKPRVVSAPMSELQEKVISNHTLLALHFGMHNGSVRQDGCNPLPDQFPILSSAPMRARCGVPSSVRLGFSLILRHGGVLVKRNVLGP